MNKSAEIDDSPKIGIAITTMNRAQTLKRLLRLIGEYTSNNHFIVVCDDGSADETEAVARHARVAYVGGERRGVAWNKNRGLYYLLNATTASHILMIDDDIVPVLYAWDEEWVRAIDRFGHVNFAHRDFDDQIVGPREFSATRPGLSSMLSGVCLGFSRRVISEIGYMDNRFGLYGYEHADLTERSLRAGYGGVRADRSLYLVIRGGLDLLNLSSNASQKDIDFSTRHYSSASRADGYLLPWHDAQQHALFMEELRPAMQPHFRFRLEDIETYMGSNMDVEQSLSGAIRHWLQYGQYEGRAWTRS